MTKNVKIPASDEAWDSGQLGRDQEFTKRADDDIEAKIDESLELQLISIRLPKSLIEEFKFIAELNGLGYQPLMRQVLKRFAEGEKKQILRDAVCKVIERRKRAAEEAATKAAEQKAA